MKSNRETKDSLYGLSRKTNMKSNGREHNQFNIKKIEFYIILLKFVFRQIDGVELIKTYYVGNLFYQKKYIFSYKQFSSLRISKGKKINYIRVHFNETMSNVRSEINLELLKKVS